MGENEEYRGDVVMSYKRALVLLAIPVVLVVSIYVCSKRGNPTCEKVWTWIVGIKGRVKQGEGI